MQNPPDPRPVYEYDQVLTVYDLQAIMKGYAHQYGQIPFWNWRKKFMYRIAVNVMMELVHWLAHGKPTHGMKCGEDGHV